MFMRKQRTSVLRVARIRGDLFLNLSTVETIVISNCKMDDEKVMGNALITKEKYKNV